MNRRFDPVYREPMDSLGIRTYSGLLIYRDAARITPSLLDAADSKPLSKERFKHFILHGVFPEGLPRRNRLTDLLPDMSSTVSQKSVSPTIESREVHS